MTQNDRDVVLSPRQTDPMGTFQPCSHRNQVWNDLDATRQVHCDANQGSETTRRKRR